MTSSPFIAHLNSLMEWDLERDEELLLMSLAKEYTPDEIKKAWLEFIKDNEECNVHTFAIYYRLANPMRRKGQLTLF